MRAPGRSWRNPGISPDYWGLEFLSHKPYVSLLQDGKVPGDKLGYPSPAFLTPGL